MEREIRKKDFPKEKKNKDLATWVVGRLRKPTGIAIKARFLEIEDVVIVEMRRKKPDILLASITVDASDLNLDTIQSIQEMIDAKEKRLLDPPKVKVTATPSVLNAELQGLKAEWAIGPILYEPYDRTSALPRFSAEETLRRAEQEQRLKEQERLARLLLKQAETPEVSVVAKVRRRFNFDLDKRKEDA